MPEALTSDTLAGMAEKLDVPDFIQTLKVSPLSHELSGMTVWRWTKGELPEFARYLFAYPELAAALARDAENAPERKRKAMREALGRKAKK